MQAVQGYRPQAPRTASVGASLAISGAIVAALAFASPNVVQKVEKVFTTVDYTDPIPPQPDPSPLPKPTTAQQPKLVAPDPIVETRSDTALDTQRDIPIVPPQPIVVDKAGPPVVADPPKPPAPFVPAAQDPRYARDYQPQYPSEELRRQRDGLVSVRVLIGADGRVKQIEQISATSSAFFDATRRQALAKWRFKPATRGGVPEDSWKQLTVRFRIEDLR